jgi:hypothetical protein
MINGSTIFPAFIIVVGLATSVLCLVAYMQRRGVGIVISATTFLSMALGAFSIAMFYYTVLEATVHGHNLPLVFMSRLLWLFILINTAILALSAIKRKDGNTNE